MGIYSLVVCVLTKSKYHLKKLQRAETDVQCDCDQNGSAMTYVRTGYDILVCMAADTGLYLDMWLLRTPCP